MFLIPSFFLGKVIFLLSLAFILSSSTLIDSGARKSAQSRQVQQPPPLQTPKSKYYTNKKGSEVVEIGPGNTCQIFKGEDASWVLDRKRENVKALNYIQFRFMVGKCQLEAFLNNRAPYAHPLRNKGENGGNEPSQNGSASIREDSVKQSSIVLPVTLRPVVAIVTKNDSQSYTNDVEPTEGSKMPLIFPGTKWCGAGATARYHEDLGIYVETDKCCRAHDLCEDSMEGKECKHGLCNDSEFTRSHCECDEKFRACLQKDKTFSSLASFKIANLYFNILKPLCYAERPPVKWCRRHRITGECIDFEFDPVYRSEWQFFPAQPFLTAAVQKLINPALPLPAQGPFFPPPLPPLSSQLPPKDEDTDEEGEEGEEERRSLRS